MSKYSNVYGPTTDLEETAISSQNSNLSFDTDTKILSWTKSGERSIVVAARRIFDFNPLDGITYPVGVYFKGVQVVYRGSESSVDLSNLLGFFKDWYFYVYAFNGVQSTEKYNRDVVQLFVPHDRIFDFSFDESFE